MSLNRVHCPECGAGLKSPTGFTVGQKVCCPKCETYFTVEDPANAVAGKKPVKAAVAGDDDYDQPKKKRRAVTEDHESGQSYKNSPLRYAILGVLVCVMVGLGVMLYLKKRDEGKGNDTGGDNVDTARPITPRIVGGAPVGDIQPVNPGAGNPVQSGPRPKAPSRPKTGNPPSGGGFGIPLLDGAPTLSGPEAAAKLKEYQQKIVGTWKAKLGGGTEAELVYRANGTFTDTLTTGGTPKTVSGTWTADRVIAGGKGVLITRTVEGARTTVRAEFEGDELLHDTQDRGTVGTFRK